MRHLYFAGTTGVGKSQGMMRFLDQIRTRGDKLIAADSNGLFLSHYYREGSDVILNPKDARTHAWDAWDEGEHWSEYDNQAKALIPQGGNDPFWSSAAQMLFSSAMHKMQHDPKRDYDKLLALLFQAPLKEIHHYFANSDAAMLTDMSIQKTTTCIRTLLALYLKCFRLLPPLDGTRPRFSIRQWIKDDHDHRWLFLPFLAKDKTALTPLISLWLDLACMHILSTTPDDHRRIWFVIDELPTIQKLPSLQNIAEVRKFGGSFMIGFQNRSQLVERYGEKTTEGLLDLFNTQFYFSCNEASVAQWVSRQLGEQEVIRAQESVSYGANHIRDGASLSKVRRVEPLVRPTAVMQLPDLAFYAKTFGNQLPVLRSALKHCARKIIAPRFVHKFIHKYLEKFPMR